MKIPFQAGTVLAALALFSPQTQAEVIKTKWQASGAMSLMHLNVPQKLTLSPLLPEGLRKAPPDLISPQYGFLSIGPEEAPISVIVALTEPRNAGSNLLIDANGNGDLTDDPPVAWKKVPYKANSGKEFMQDSGEVTLLVHYGKQTRPLHLHFYRYDLADPERALYHGALFYQADYAPTGTVTLSGKPYTFWLADNTASGDFRKKPSLSLLIDTNGNGVIDLRGEMYSVMQPFNIGGTTYEISEISVDGSSLKIVKSAKTVAEIPPPPDLRLGKKAPAFEGKTLEGQTISFPGQFKGKLIMLYFWASWCGDCQMDLPYVTSAYAKLHEQGLEILGISLDKANMVTSLAAFTKENRIPWANIYDGKYWKAEIAQLYCTTSIPRGILVNGDTGEVLATEDDLYGTKLEPTLQTALTKWKQRASK